MNRLRCLQYEIVILDLQNCTDTAEIKHVNKTSFLFSHKLTGIFYHKKALYPARIEDDAGCYWSKLCIYI